MKLQKLMVNSRNTEVNAVTDRIGADYEQRLAGDPVLDPIMTELIAKNLELTTAVKRMKAESELEAKDEIRDAAYHALYNFVYGLSFSSTTAVQNAADNVYKLLEHYGRALTRENYDTETSQIDSLLQDLSKTAMKAAIDVLTGCAALITTLQNAENDFKTARLTYQQERAAEGQQTNASILKLEVVDLMNKKLVALLGGLLVSNPATYSAFASTVAEIIATNNETVKQRKKEKPETADTN